MAGVGLLLIAHSERLARGLAELVRQMAPGVPLRLAAGTGDPEQPLGTNPMAVLEGLQALLQEPEVHHVVVFMDLGSAVLSAEAALEFLEPDLRQRVVLSPAPLVEGAVAAAARAAARGDVQAVLQAAQEALQAKQAQLQAGEPATPAASPSEPQGPPEAEQVVQVVNPWGLHAWPAARVVHLAARFPQTEVHLWNLTRGQGPASARSLPQLLALGVLQGHRVRVAGWGPQAAAAVEAVATYLARLQETEPAPEPSTAPPAPERARRPDRGGYVRAVAVAPGVAIGPAFPLEASWPREEPAFPSSQEALQALRRAWEQTRTRLAHEARLLEAQGHRAPAGILQAQAAVLQDPALWEAVHARVQAGQPVLQALRQAFEDAARALEALESPLLRARAQDVRAVGLQVALALLGREGLPLPPEPAIVVARSVDPGWLHRARERVLGLATLEGGPTTHTGVVARSLGVPAVAGVPEEVLRAIEPGTPLALDGETGELWVRPEDATVQALEARRADRARREAEHRARARQPAITRDGVPVTVMANIRGPHEAREAAAWGAEGSGLVRTEFLYVGRPAPPDEEEQVAAYRAIFQALAPHPVTVRTADIGGDKPVPYLNLEEANPFLGVRGLRLSLAYPELFRTQLRALFRAAVGYRVRVMFPMVTLVEEWEAALEHVQAVLRELEARREPFQEVPLGIMVEVPAVVPVLEHFFRRGVAFVSLGTNDLAQYTLAADRTHPQVATLADGLHPAVLRLIQATVETARSWERPVSVCGELAGDEEALPVLLGLGVQQLSVACRAIPRVKARVRALTLAAARDLAHEVLGLPDALAVRERVRSWWEEQSPRT